MPQHQIATTAGSTRPGRRKKPRLNRGRMIPSYWVRDPARLLLVSAVITTRCNEGFVGLYQYGAGRVGRLYCITLIRHGNPVPSRIPPSSNALAPRTWRFDNEVLACENRQGERRRSGDCANEAGAGRFAGDGEAGAARPRGRQDLPDRRRGERRRRRLLRPPETQRACPRRQFRRRRAGGAHGPAPPPRGQGLRHAQHAGLPPRAGGPGDDRPPAGRGGGRCGDRPGPRPGAI